MNQAEIEKLKRERDIAVDILRQIKLHLLDFDDLSVNGPPGDVAIWGRILGFLMAIDENKP